MNLRERLMGVFASLFFSIPTACLLWFGINTQLAFGGSFLDVDILVGCIAILAVLAFLMPKLFPAILGWLWEMMMRLFKHAT